MNETLMALGAVAAMVWPATELLGAAFKGGPKMLSNKSALAVYLGLLMGLVMHGSGTVDLGPGIWGWVSALMFGLFATATAAGTHNTAKVVRKKVLDNGAS